jgi:hypothetical protein
MKFADSYMKFAEKSWLVMVFCTLAADKSFFRGQRNFCNELLLGDRLTHLIRNAAEHGVEPADAREAAGKPAEGVIALKTFPRQPGRPYSPSFPIARKLHPSFIITTTVTIYDKQSDAAGFRPKTRGGIASWARLRGDQPWVHPATAAAWGQNPAEVR